MTKPLVILFDVNGTITDPRGLGEAWGRPELGDVILSAAIQTATLDALLGSYRPFADHLRAALNLIAERHHLALDGIQAALHRAAALEPFPDAAQALELLRSAGHRLAALTNSGAAAGNRTLTAAGLGDYFDMILGVDAVRSFKPHPTTYAYALAQLETTPSQTMLVAAHGWDVTGAKHAGLLTTWIARGEGHLSAMTPEPDLRATTLLDAAQRILARGAA